MFSPLPGARTDSCVRQNPDCRASSIKLPIRPRKAQPNGSLGVMTTSGLATLAGGAHRMGSQVGPSGQQMCGKTEKGEASGHPKVCDRDAGGEEGERSPLPGLGSTLPVPRVSWISPPLSSRRPPPAPSDASQISELLCTEAERISSLLPSMQGFGVHGGHLMPHRASLNRIRREMFLGPPSPVALRPSAVAGREDRHSTFREGARWEG